MGLNKVEKDNVRYLKIKHINKVYKIIINLEKYELLKNELEEKYSVARQVIKNDALINNQEPITTIYEYSSNYNMYGYIQLMDYSLFNYRASQDGENLYRYVSILANIIEKPAICKAIELTLADKEIDLNYIKKYIEQFLTLKEYEIKNGQKVIPPNLTTNNYYNITTKERQMSLDEFKVMLSRIIDCFEIKEMKKRKELDSDMNIDVKNKVMSLTLDNIK